MTNTISIISSAIIIPDSDDNHWKQNQNVKDCCLNPGETNRTSYIYEKKKKNITYSKLRLTTQALDRYLSYQILLNPSIFLHLFQHLNNLTTLNLWNIFGSSFSIISMHC